MTADTLLPPNARPFEIALERAATSGMQLDADAIRRTKQPWTISESMLPFLAHDLSVDFWNDAWPLTRKRQVTAGAFDLHRRKGTLWAIRQAAKLADAEVVRATLPPAKTFCAPSLTAAEREAFLAKYPELRLYRYRSAGEAGRGAFAYRLFAAPWKFPVASTAAARYGRQAYFYRDGQETALRTVTRYTETREGLAVDYDEVRRPGVAIGAFAGVLRGRCAYDHKAAGRMYRLRTETRYTTSAERVHFNTVKPSLETMGYDSQPVAQRGQRRGVFAGGSYAGQHPVPTDATTRIYDRLWLFDPSVPLESRGRSTHLGGARLGMPAFHAEIVLRMRGRRPLFMAGRFVYGALTASDQTPYREALAAVASACSARDRVFIQTSTMRPVTAGVAVMAGDYIAGSIQESV